MSLDGNEDHWIFRASRRTDSFRLDQQNMGRPQYVLLDGDQVGRRMEDLLLRDALPRLYFLVQDLNEAVLLLARVFRKAGGLVYLVGGDTVLGSVDDIRPLLAGMQSVRHALPCTFSAGVGSSVRDALIALKLAKARGSGELRTAAYSSKTVLFQSRSTRSSASPTFGGDVDSRIGASRVRQCRRC